jgi:hypothetical protein
MKLTGKVIKLESGSEFIDKQERVYVRLIEGGDSLYNTFRVPNVDSLMLDDTLTIEVSIVKAQLARSAS